MTLAIAAPPVVATQEAPLVQPEFEEAPAPIVYHKFTVDDYYRMLDIGILTEDDRVELIDGEVREMSPIDPIHAATIDRLNYYLGDLLRNRAIVRVQNPVRLSEYNEPQPDVAIVRWRDDFYMQKHPLPEDTFIAIEVANTSLVYDRKEKLPRYAAAGIPEVWLVNIARQTVEQYAKPVNGQYMERQIVNRGQGLVAQAIDGVELPIDHIFGQKLA